MIHRHSLPKQRYSNLFPYDFRPLTFDDTTHTSSTTNPGYYND